MSAKWVVTAAVKEIKLDGGDRKCEITFTVTNTSDAADRAVLDVEADKGDPAWFTVEEPQRVVRAGASVAYVVKGQIPADVAGGDYAVNAQVYSADSAPEESSVRSPQVKLTVAEPPKEEPKRIPWWIIAIAAGVLVLLLVVVGALVFSGGDDEPAETAGVPGVMPDLIGVSERDALDTLADLGLTVRPIQYWHQPEQADTVVVQEPAAGIAIDRTTLVDLRVAVALAPPGVIGITDVPVVGPGEPLPTLQWERSGSPANRWRVLLYPELCAPVQLGIPGTPMPVEISCQFPESATVSFTVEEPSYTPDRSRLTLQPLILPAGQVYNTGWVRWRVAAVDHAGGEGPSSDIQLFRIPPRQPQS